MTRKPVFALFVLLMLAVVMIPAMPVKAWEYQDGTPSDTKFEMFGPRADKVLIKLYASELSEFDALGAGEIDITDWPLTKAYYDLYTAPPYSDDINVVFHGDEFGISLLAINNNNNQYLGNPPNAVYTNPVYPNPCSVVEMRQAIAYLIDRAQFDTIIGAGFYAPLYTTHGPSYGGYSHPEIRPGGTLEYLTYPYDVDDAIAKLEAGGFTLTGSPDGWRYWDRNGNHVRDAGEWLELKVFIPTDNSILRDFLIWLCDQLEAVWIHVIRVFGSSEAAELQVMANKDFHLYGDCRRLGVDPDHAILWNWDYYWHPGRPQNYAGINDPDLNEYSYGVMLANTQLEALTNCLLFQERYAEIAASIPLYSLAGSKGMSRCYTGGNGGVPAGDDEDIYRGQYWEGAVNLWGYGVDSGWSLMNMHPQGYETGDGESMTIRYGFRTNYIGSFNPVYANGLWDWNILFLIYDSLLKRDPYNQLKLKPWIATQYETGTYTHPVYGTCSKVWFTLGPDIFWADGWPLTIADVYFTLVELPQILAARGLPPPWWISNVAFILDFSILDPYNFEVLFAVKSFFATSWAGEQPILPKHIWKPIAEGLTGNIEDVAPDPNMIGNGPFRFCEYVEYSHVLLVANSPEREVTTSHPGATPVMSEAGYCRILPFESYANITDPPELEWLHKFPPNMNLSLPEAFDNRYATEAMEVSVDGNATDNVGGVTYQFDQHNETLPPAEDCIGIGLSVEVEFAWVDFDFKKETQWSRRTSEPWYARNTYKVKLHLWMDITCGVGARITVSIGLKLYGITIFTLWEKTWTLAAYQTTFRLFDVTVEKTFKIWGSFGTKGKWYNIDPVRWYGTLREDIVGSTLYDDIGNPTYPYKAQLPSPDFKVDIKDIAVAAKAFGAYPGHTRWNTVADINRDYKIDIKDIAAIAKKYGWTRSSQF